MDLAAEAVRLQNRTLTQLRCANYGGINCFEWISNGSTVICQGFWGEALCESEPFVDGIPCLYLRSIPFAISRNSTGRARSGW